MHKEARDFTEHVKTILPDFFVNKKVLDIGCADINGNNRSLFQNCEYTGNDIMPHANVDIVAETSKLPFTEEIFDTIVSTECFEHDMHYTDSLRKIIQILKQDGLFFFTCASTGRPEHGTLRTSGGDSLTTKLDEIPEWKDYYKNLTEQDIKEVIDVDNVFSYYEFYRNKASHDLYFFGIKRGTIYLDQKPSFTIYQKPHVEKI